MPRSIRGGEVSEVMSRRDRRSWGKPEAFSEGHLVRGADTREESGFWRLFGGFFGIVPGATPPGAPPGSPRRREATSPHRGDPQLPPRARGPPGSDKVPTVGREARLKPAVSLGTNSTVQRYVSRVFGLIGIGVRIRRNPQSCARCGWRYDPQRRVSQSGSPFLVPGTSTSAMPPYLPSGPILRSPPCAG